MITLYNENDVRIRDIRIYEINDADMGESTITASVKFDQVMQFHPDWYVLVDGEKYKLGVTEPSGKRSTTQINVEYSLTFHSSREDLKRYTFMDFVEYGSGNPQPSQHTFSIQACTLAQFVSRFNTNLQYYLGSLWTIELSDDADPSIVANLTFDRASLWDVLLEVYNNYGVRWTIQNDNGIMSIIVGKDATELQTIFEYGNGNGLISVERTNPMERIVTRLRGKGSERNLPVNYFHAATSAYPIGDPDTNTILQGIYYNRLYPKCYRDYVRGYNSGESRTGESWAYQQGVADKIAGKPMNIVDFAKSDKEGLWGISYGAIEDNDAIYPTLQGATRDGVELDRVLAVSPIYVDSPEDEAAGDPFIQVDGAKGSFQGRDIHILYNGRDGGITSVTGIDNAKSATAESGVFTLETSINTIKAKFLVTPTKYADFYATAVGVTDPVSPTLTTVSEMVENHWNFIEKIQLVNADNDTVVRTWNGDNLDFFDIAADDIPAGRYKFRSYIEWYKNVGYTYDELLYTVDWQLYGCEFAVYDSELARQSYSDTFDIWIGNVWNTTKRTDETNEDYAFRVWSPLVSKDEMTVMFSDGLLAGEDYEFPIVGAVAEAENLEEIIKKAIHYDTSVTGSHWRLSLKKSDAEFEASGKYLPNSVVNAVAGNHFFFINILMPYDPYVYDAERKQQEYLEEQLALLDVELPTFAVVPSSVFMASFSEVGDVKPGNKIRLLDTSLIGSSYTTVYIQSVTKRHTENKINPDWSLVVSDQIIVGGNPISLIDGKVEALSRQMYSSKQATRDAIEAMSQFYLRKDGLADTSFSPTDFRAPVTLRDRLLDYNFRQGDFGGYGFGVYTDPDGKRVVEADVLVGRMALRVNEIVVNQVDYVGGQRIYSAAAMTVSRLEETDTIWRCYFDNKQGSVQNLFLVGDLAFCQRFKGTEEGGYTTYWSKVMAIGSDYIELSKTDIMSAGSGSPSVGDNIIQLGNISDQDRQSAIIMSSYGANSPSLRLYHGINGYSLNNKDMFGVEYDSVNQIPYFYNYGSMRLGARTDAEGGFITYNHISKQLNIKAVVNFLPQSTGLEQMEAYQKLVQIAQGNIETWFHDDVTPAQTGAPTLTNYPVNSWEVADYENHIGDIYYSNTGKGYRFKRSGNGWAWEIISDAELAQIMAEVQNLQYLKTALGQDTTVAGGLILTSLIQLGYKDAQDVRHTMAGISGLGQNDRGIAAWFGGPMVDHELNPTATDYAKSLLRFDGTGYLAKGNITWDTNGYGQVGGSGSNYAVKWDASGVRLGNGVYIGSDSDKTLGSILALLNKFDSWFEEDTETHTLILKKDGQYDRNFAAYGEVTAGGVGSGGSGGTGALYTCADVINFNNSKVGRSTTEGAQVGDLLAYDGTHWHAVVAPATGVTTFNGRGGAVSLTASDVTTALGYTPVNKAGDTITGATIAMDSAGLPTYGGSRVPANTLAIGRNGIGIGGIDITPDGAAIYMENAGMEKNRLIIALGDDAAQLGADDYIAFRYYNTSGQATYESKIPYKSGTIALTSDIPSNIVNTIGGKTGAIGIGSGLSVTSANTLTNTGVLSIGGQTGAITVRGGLTANGSVNLAMSGTELQASIVGLGSLAYLNGLSASDVGLGNVDNKSSATIRGEITSSNVTTALGYTPVNKAGDTMSGGLYVTDVFEILPSSSNYSGMYFRDLQGKSYHISYRAAETNKDLRIYYYDGTNYNKLVDISPSGSIGIGKTTMAYKVDVNGSLNATTIYQNGVMLGARAFDNTSYLPLSGGTLSGDIQWTTDNHKITFFGNGGIGKMAGHYPALYGESNTALFQISDGTNYYNIYHSGNCNNFTTNWDVNGLRVGGTNGYHNGYGLELYYTTSGVSGEEESVIQAFSRGAAYGDRFHPLRLSGSKIIITQGNVGIGASTPSEKLHVAGNVLATGNITANGNMSCSNLTASGNATISGNVVAPAGKSVCLDLRSSQSTTDLNFSRSTTNLWQISHRGNTEYNELHFYYNDGSWHKAIGITTNGDIVATGEVTAGSDARWKHDITPVFNGIDTIMRLHPSEWEWNSDNHKGSGLIAQDVQKVIPHLVKTDSEGFLHLTYDGLHAYEISALQSHETRIERLERENRELKMEIQRLRN